MADNAPVTEVPAATPAAAAPAAPAATPAQFAELKGLEIAEFPCIDQKKRRYDEATADQLVATFAEFADKTRPPLVLGHNVLTTEDGKPVAGATGAPALGWIRSLRRKGKKVLADIAQVPMKVKDLIDKGAYKRLSASWWPDGAAVGLASAAGKAVLRHVGLLGADTPAVKTLADVQALFDGTPGAAATFAEPADADVADFQEAAPAVAAVAADPATLKEAVQKQAAGDEFEPVFGAISNRLWVIRDRTGRSRDEILSALDGLGAEIVKFTALLRAAAGAAPTAIQTAAAQMSDPAAAAVATEPPASAGGLSDPPAVTQALRHSGTQALAPAEMSDTDKQVVEVFLTRATAEGRLKPKHHPFLRAQAAACFAQGGAEAVASFVDDENERRGAKVLALGETAPAVKPAEAPAEMSEADPGAVAEAEAEFDRHGLGKALHITKAEYVKARTAKK